MNSIKSLTCKQRLLRVLAVWTGLGLLGLFYASIASRFGGIPCVFRTVTGLRCPGCGVTHMCLCLLRGDLLGAFRENAAVLCLVPVLAPLLVHQSLRYVKLGTLRLFPWEEKLAWAMAAMLLLFGVVRNLFF